VCSVCIANYNGVGVIEACIESVLNQTWSLPTEIIVHDDASTDASVALVRERYPQVCLIESRDNVGFCVSNNRMVERARGEYVLLLNNDAELLPDALGTLYAAARAQGAPSILGLPQYDAATGALIDRGSLFDPFLNPIPNTDPHRRDVGMVIGACLWLPRSLWIEIGGFPEWLHTLAEDMYLCCVARRWGYRVCVLDGSGFRHRVGFSLGGGLARGGKLVTSLRRRRLSERNKTWVMMVTYPAAALLPIALLHVAALLIEGLLMSLALRSSSLFGEVYWHAVAATWRNRRLLLGDRTRVQKRKRARSRFFAVFKWLPHKLELLLRHGLPQVKA
jgi:hypothetical protein